MAAARQVPSGGLDKSGVRRPSPLLSCEGCKAWRRQTEAACHSGGVLLALTVQVLQHACRRDKGDVEAAAARLVAEGLREM